jgi:hypothetical protein
MNATDDVRVRGVTSTSPDLVLACPPVAVVLGQKLKEKEIATQTGEEAEQVPYLERRLLGATGSVCAGQLRLHFHKIMSETLAPIEST